jgi:hypothetical protein
VENSTFPEIVLNTTPFAWSADGDDSDERAVRPRNEIETNNTKADGFMIYPVFEFKPAKPFLYT